MPKFKLVGGKSRNDPLEPFTGGPLDGRSYIRTTPFSPFGSVGAVMSPIAPMGVTPLSTPVVPLSGPLRALANKYQPYPYYNSRIYSGSRWRSLYPGYPRLIRRRNFPRRFSLTVNDPYLSVDDLADAIEKYVEKEKQKKNKKSIKKVPVTISDLEPKNSSGIVIFNDTSNKKYILLVQQNNGNWSPPGGKIETRDRVNTTANQPGWNAFVREFNEEVGSNHHNLPVKDVKGYTYDDTIIYVMELNGKDMDNIINDFNTRTHKSEILNTGFVELSNLKKSVKDNSNLIFANKAQKPGQNIGTKLENYAVASFKELFTTDDRLKD